MGASHWVERFTSPRPNALREIFFDDLEASALPPKVIDAAPGVRHSGKLLCLLFRGSFSMASPVDDFATRKAALQSARNPAEREAAMLGLVQSAQPFIRQLASRLIQSRHRFDSEDIQQSVCLRLVRQLKFETLELRTEAEFFGLVKTMVRNLVLDRERQRAPRISLDAQSADDSDTARQLPDSHMPTPSLVARAEELRDALWRELSSCLQPDELFLAREHWGKETSQRELATQLGLSEDAVRMRLQRAKKKIRERLGDECQWVFE